MNMIAAAAAALLAVQTTPGPPVQCIPAQQLTDLSIVLMPTFVDAARQRCGPHLSNGFLSSPQGAALAERYRGAGAPRRANAARAVRLIAGNNIPRALSGETIMAVMTEGMIGEALASVDAPRCRAIDSLVASLAPLAPENMGQAVSAIYTLVSLGEARRRSMPPVCPASAN
ncbi:MAG TPA: hypothetical protein VEZ20_01805 [Allosphingosinicella sp.]|jgi:hypothetical protein|nr:hypothetical protein [Allosphingosinicella sp.]